MENWARGISNDAPGYTSTVTALVLALTGPGAYPLSSASLSRPTMSSGVDQLPRTLHLASSPIRDTVVSGEFYLSTLQVVLTHLYIQMIEAVCNMYFYPPRTPHKLRAALTMVPTSCSPCIMKKQRNMTRSWPKTGGRTRRVSCS